MKDQAKKTGKGIKVFNTVYMVGVAFVVIKLIDYLQWTFQLVKKWQLPEEPFFSKVNLVNSDAEISVTAYLVFAIAYILVFGFIILGFNQLNRMTKLFAEQKIFQEEVSLAFNRAGKLFLAFAYGTLIVDIAFLIWADTSSRVIDLLSTELLIFLVVGYLMFFLADVFKQGVTLQKENELTI